jgi:hypothetical protein
MAMAVTAQPKFGHWDSQPNKYLSEIGRKISGEWDTRRWPDYSCGSIHSPRLVAECAGRAYEFDQLNEVQTHVHVYENLERKFEKKVAVFSVGLSENDGNIVINSNKLGPKDLEVVLDFVRPPLWNIREVEEKTIKERYFKIWRSKSLD